MMSTGKRDRAWLLLRLSVIVSFSLQICIWYCHLLHLLDHHLVCSAGGCLWYDRFQERSLSSGQKWSLSLWWDPTASVCYIRKDVYRATSVTDNVFLHPAQNSLLFVCLSIACSTSVTVFNTIV